VVPFDNIGTTAFVSDLSNSFIPETLTLTVSLKPEQDTMAATFWTKPQPSTKLQSWLPQTAASGTCRDQGNTANQPDPRGASTSPGQ
jgi:hypothetical protein